MPRLYISAAPLIPLNIPVSTFSRNQCRLSTTHHLSSRLPPESMNFQLKLHEYSVFFYKKVIDYSDTYLLVKMKGYLNY